MPFKAKKILGLEKLHPDIQFFLDCTNLTVARTASIIVMAFEVITFTISFFYVIQDQVKDPARWMLYHRILYVLLFLAGSQLCIYSFKHKPEKGKISRAGLNFSITIFILMLLIFAICITIHDYILHEQILVFITIELLVSCLFMIKPYIAIPTILISFGVFYYLMKSTIGVSDATNINYTIIMAFFIFVNIVHYQQYLRIAKHNVINHALAEQLRRASLFDFLTKLKNRNALNSDFVDSSKLNSNYIVMLTDIDNFKSYNDNFGHLFGDELLKKFAGILQKQFGKEYCYRYGGDEYLIVLPEIKKEEFLEKLKSCEEIINNEFEFSGGYYNGLITSSKDLNDYINKADKYLYEAKNTGKNQVCGSFTS